MATVIPNPDRNCVALIVSMTTDGIAVAVTTAPIIAWRIAENEKLCAAAPVLPDQDFGLHWNWALYNLKEKSGWDPDGNYVPRGQLVPALQKYILDQRKFQERKRPGAKTK